MTPVMVRAMTAGLALVVVGVGSAWGQGHTPGRVRFATSCSAAAQERFETGLTLLHSVALDEAIKTFGEAARLDPECGIAHWGAAVAWRGYPLTAVPTPAALTEGWEAAQRAKAVGARSARERDYIAAIAAFFADADPTNHGARALAYARAMESLAARYPDDREAAVLHALAVCVTQDPTDRTHANQLKAATILERVFATEPHHPGIGHYLMHLYDVPPLARQGVAAARRYAAAAPASPHLLHLPSHIFTRVGMWPESIDTNRAAARAAGAALPAGASGVASFEALHAWDYMMYGFMQLARDGEARALVNQVRSTRTLDIEHFAGAFALVAIPARYVLERRQWREAVALTLMPPDLAWDKFPQAESMIWFARGLGAARGGDLGEARKSADRLAVLRDALIAGQNGYWAEQSEIQRLVVAAWIAHGEGQTAEALVVMRQAAERESAAGKHPVTPGPLFPAREMLGELLLAAGRPAEALAEFEQSNTVEPNRFLGLYGAARAAAGAGQPQTARRYYAQLVELAKSGDGPRPEIAEARAFLAQGQ